MSEQHTSGAQRAAEHEATGEQRAEWERRLHSRAVQLDVELRDLATAAAAHGDRDADYLAARARMARDALAGRRVQQPVPDRPPFAEELVVSRPPHEDPDLAGP